MPIKKSAFKSLRQANKQAERNKKLTSDIAALIRKVRKSITGKDDSKAREWLQATIKKIDKAAQKGVLQKNSAARKKSRLVKAVNAISKK